LLGHIISKDGVKIDPERVSVVSNIGLPKNKNEIQSFLKKINFLRRSIPNYVEIVKEIIDMLNKDRQVKWVPEAKHSFN